MAKRAVRLFRAPGIPTIRPKVLRAIPHDRDAHTQGLAYAHGHLYESTGIVGTSSLRKIDIHTGQVLQAIAVPGVWAEGVAVSDGRLVQITYTEGLALCYRLSGLEFEDSYRYQGDGWGLAATEHGYIMSDGSDVLQFRSSDFTLLSKLRVRLAGRPLRGLNDLEFLQGRVYVCVLWHSDIYEICARSGEVLRVVDCTELVEQSGRSGYENLLNGIAFAPDRGTFFVTGKNWPMLFEVELARN